MIILVKRRILVLVAVAFMLGCGLGMYVLSLFKTNPTAVLDQSVTNMLKAQIQHMFDVRSNSLLQQDIEALSSLYNKGLKFGLWAYEHEIKKMKYLHKWSAKQGVSFKEINSNVLVRYAKEKGDGYSLNLLVSTEYKYQYEGSETIDTCRIGTYHSLDLVPMDEKWVITREWYTDPFADSLNLDELKNQEFKKLILSEEFKQEMDMNERRTKALEYIDQYCGAASLPEYGYQYNPKYRNFNSLGGDCANFASQMLYAGGFRRNGTWNYERGSGSRAWVNASAFNQYWVYSGRASLIARGTYDQVLKASYKCLPGDYVAYERNGKVVHISVISGRDSKGYALVNSHNSDRYRVPWDLGWSNRGIKFWLVRVHY